RILEHRASRQRRLPLAGATSQPSARHPPRVRGHAAFRAQEPVRPTQAADVLPAPVEPKSEFVEVVIEVLLLDAAPMSGRLRCRACEWETSLTAGTVFQDTRKPLRMWFLAMWFVTSQKNGVSALGLQRELGLGSYETAWTWLHKLRRAMVRPGRDNLTGEIEVDETYVGGAQEGKRGRGAEKKAIVAV